MKSYLSKLSVVLLGVALAVSGCQDYDEDIRKVNAQLTQDVENISGVTAALDAAIAELESKHDVDINALKSDLQGVEADLAAKATEIEEAIDEASAAAAALIKANADNDAADKKELQGKINDLTVNVATRLAELKQDYEAADQQLNQTMGQLMATAMTEITGVKNKVTALENRASALETAVEDLKNADQTLQGNINAAVAKAENELLQAKTELSNSIGFLSTLIADAVEDIEANAEEIAKLKTALKDAKDELQDAIDAEEAARVAADNAEAAAREQAINDLNAALSARIDAEVAARELLEQKVTDEVERLEGLIDDVNDALADEIEAREQAIEEVEGKIEQLGEDLEAAQNELKQLIADEADARKKGDDKLAAELAIERGRIETNINDIKTLQADLKENVEALTALITANTGRIEANEKAIAAIETELENRRVAFEAYKTEVTNALATKADKTALQDAIKKAEDELAAAIKAEQEARAEALEALETKIKEITDALDERLTALEGKVENLANLVQEIVFVPEYADGKIGVPYYDFYQQPVQGKPFYLTFKISPAEFVGDIARVQSILKLMSFDVRPVKPTASRAAAKEPQAKLAQSMYLVHKEADKGLVQVMISVTGLDDEFYTDPEGCPYVISASIDNAEGTHISTPYINLTSEKAGEITMQIRESKRQTDVTGKLTDAEDVQEIPYTKADEPKTILEKHRLLFVLGKNQTKTYADMIRNYFDLGELTTEIEYNYSENGEGLFTFEEVENQYKYNDVVVRLDESKIAPANVGESVNVVYNYTVMGKKVSAGSVVEITKEPLKFVLPAQTATWTYALDVDADAYLFNNTLPEATYNRTFADLTAEVDNPASKITLKDLATADLKSIKVNGKTSTNAELIFDTAANNVDVKYTDFAWGETYKIEAVYDLPSSRVTVEFEFNTVGRQAGAIDITLDPQTFELYKDIDEVGDNRSLESMVQLLKDKNYLDAEADAAKYLADYKANAPVMSDSKVVADDADYIAGTATTGFQFDAADASKVYPAINANDFPADKEIPTAMTYKAVITTWYGQVINISQDINLELPAYDYKHDNLWVKEENGGFYSQVMGKYVDANGNSNIKTHDLAEYSADLVDMLRAFAVYEGETKIAPAKFAELGLVPEFSLEKTYDGIELDANVLKYNGSDDSVDVTAKLYLENTNGSKVALPTSFDGEDAKYADYIVKKPVPVAALGAGTHTEHIIDVKLYEIPVMQYFTLMENKLNVEPEYNHSLIDAATNDWTLGTGDNGFADGKSVTEIYGLNYDWSNVVIPESIKEVVTFDQDTRVLTFDNSKTISLFEDVTVEIELHIEHTWGADDATLYVTFPKNVK